MFVTHSLIRLSFSRSPLRCSHASLHSPLICPRLPLISGRYCASSRYACDAQRGHVVAMSYGHDHYVTRALSPSISALSPCDSALKGACDDTRAHATVARSGGGCSFTHCHCVVRATDDRRYRHARCVSKIYLAGNRNVAMRMIVLCYCSIARFSLAVQCASAATLMRPPSHSSRPMVNCG